MQTLVARYRQPLKAFFERRVFNPAEAEDLTQEVFLRFIRKSMACDILNAEAFLFRAALNLLRDRSRRSKVRLSSLQRFGEQQRAHDYATPERLAIARESLSAICDELQKVGDRSGVIFLLHRIEGMDYRQIAAARGISVSAVEKHMIKVLARLARYQ